MLRMRFHLTRLQLNLGVGPPEPHCFRESFELEEL